MSYLMLYSVDCILNDHRVWFWKYQKKPFKDRRPFPSIQLKIGRLYNSPCHSSILYTYLCITYKTQINMLSSQMMGPWVSSSRSTRCNNDDSKIFTIIYARFVFNVY